MTYTYGMKLRGFSIGCQPKEGFIERKDDTTGKYYDVIVYERELTNEEIEHYGLERIEKGNKMNNTKATVIPMIKQLESLFTENLRHRL